MGKKQHQKDKMYLTTTEWSTLYGGKRADAPGNWHKSASFLDQFFLLAEFDTSTRLTAVARIIRLISEQFTNSKGSQKDQEIVERKEKLDVGDRRLYTLKRLLRGLVSSNKCARIGYSDALAEVLRRIYYTPEEFAKSMNEWLSLQAKEDRSQIFIGRLLAWGALIRARRVIPLLTECMEDLLHMGQREFLESAVCQLFVELLSSVGEDSFVEVAWPKVHQHLAERSKDPTPLASFIVMAVRQHYPHLALEINAKKLLSQDFMYSVLQKSTSQLPYIHPVVPMMVEEARSSRDLDQFWANVVDKLGSAPSAEKHFLLLHMLKTAFIQFDSLDFLMKETYVEQLVYPLVKTSSPLYAQARSFVIQLESLDNKKAKDILRFILSHPKGYRFDHMTSSSLVAKTLQKANPNVVQWYAKKLQQRLEALQGTDNEHQADENHIKFETIIMEQLANLTHMSNMLGQADFKRSVCEYMAATHFSGDARLDKKSNVQALLKALTPSGKANSLLEAADNIAAVLRIYLSMEKWHPSSRHEKKLRAASKLMSKLNKCEKETDARLALRILVGYLALCYILGVQTDITVLDDVMSSVKAFLGGRQEGDEVGWVDLVMEALVSALSVENANFRTMVLAVLDLLHKDITTDSLILLLGVFRDDEQPQTDDQTQLEELDSAEEDSDDNDSDEDDGETGKETKEQENESGCKIDFGDAAFRNQLSTVLGVTSNGGDELEVEATDEDMMKLDKAISAAFGARFNSLSSTHNKENKKKELQALHFEMKCLHILDSYVKSANVSLGHIVLICKTLITFATSKRAKNIHRPITTHIAKTVRDVSCLKLPKIRMNETSGGELKEFGALIVEKIQGVNEPELRAALSSLLPFVVKCIKVRDDDEEWYFNIYRDLLKTYVEQPMTFVAPPLFVRFIEVFKEHCLVLVDAIEAVLVDCCVQRREKRVQLMGLLVASLRLCNPEHVNKRQLKKSMKKLAVAVTELLRRREELAFSTNLYVESLDLMRLISKKCQGAELEDPIAPHSSELKEIFKNISSKNLPFKLKRRLNSIYHQFFPGKHFQADKKQAKKNKKEMHGIIEDADQSLTPFKKRRIFDSQENGQTNVTDKENTAEYDNDDLAKMNRGEERERETESTKE